MRPANGNYESAQVSTIGERAMLPPPVERPVCAVCKHFDCKAQEGATVCVFCEDGVACPVAREAMQRRPSRPTISAAPVLRNDRFLGRERVHPEKEGSMEFKKKCACGKGIRAGKGGVVADQCRACRMKAKNFLKRRGRRKKNGCETGGLQPVPGMVTVALPVRVIDEWWASLPAPEKAAAFAAHLRYGAMTMPNGTGLRSKEA